MDTKFPMSSDFLASVLFSGPVVLQLSYPQPLARFFFLRHWQDLVGNNRCIFLVIIKSQRKYPRRGTRSNAGLGAAGYTFFLHGHCWARIGCFLSFVSWSCFPVYASRSLHDLLRTPQPKDGLMSLSHGCGIRVMDHDGIGRNGLDRPGWNLRADIPDCMHAC